MTCTGVVWDRSMDFEEYVRWIVGIRDKALADENKAGRKWLHDQQFSMNLLEVARAWDMHEVQEKSYAAQRTAEKWTKTLTVLTIVLVALTAVLIVLTARLSL